MKKLFIRTDSSAIIGTGHLKRCLTLVQALSRYYPDPVFLINSEAHALFPSLAKEFTTITIPKFNSQQEEAEYLVASISNFENALVVVDHYQLDVIWERIIASAGNQIIAIDDLNRSHLAELVIDQNFRAPDSACYLDNKPAGKLLMGLNYCLIDQSYTKDLSITNYFERSQRVLTNFGGGNVKSLVEKVVQSVRGELLDRWQLDLVVGSNLKADNEIKNLIEEAEFNYHSELPSLAPLMVDSQLALGAGGTSHWERFFLGLPSMVFSIADNQRQINQDLADAGYIIYLGEESTYDFTELPTAINSIIANSQKRLELHEKGRQLVDGRGAKRIAAEIVALELGLRKVNSDDSRTVWAWRNHLENRKHALNSAEIAFEQHSQWYQQILSSQRSDLLIASIAREKFGVLRFDYEDLEAKVSIYLNPEKHNSGLGLPLLIAGERFLAGRSETTRLVAYILNTNVRSQKIFADAGYTYYQSDGEHQIWHKAKV